jgi:hypothetical protein
MPAARYIKLSETEDRKLKAVEENELLHKEAAETLERFKKSTGR